MKIRNILSISLLAFLFTSCVSNSTKATESTVDSDSISASEAEEVVQVKSEANKQKADSLAQYFRVDKDEFSDYSWVYNKTTSKYRNVNDCYCYFKKTATGAENFRLVFQYEADDWLFIQNLIFNIDGENYDYTPEDFDTDCGNGGRIWEWCDDNIESQIDLIEKIAKAKKVKVKMNGRQYYDVRTLKSSEITSIKQTYEYYKALGGTFSAY